MKCREQHYATNTLAEHRRILTEGNRFKRDATRVISLLKDFTLTVSVAATSTKENIQNVLIDLAETDDVDGMKDNPRKIYSSLE